MCVENNLCPVERLFFHRNLQARRFDFFALNDKSRIPIHTTKLVQDFLQYNFDKKISMPWPISLKLIGRDFFPADFRRTVKKNRHANLEIPKKHSSLVGPGVLSFEPIRVEVSEPSTRSRKFSVQDHRSLYIFGAQ